MAALPGIGDAGVELRIPLCDLSERRMYVKARCDETAGGIINQSTSAGQSRSLHRAAPLRPLP
ncbi:hypothetical protein GCM10009609_39430 [Pseudonocardia aurantiaca]